MTLEERFEEKFVVLPDGCWAWLAGNSRGYGQYWDDGRMRAAHRVSYESLVGPVPDELDLDHLCRFTLCVNPQHLEPVTMQENVLRGYRSRGLKTHCKRGHEYSKVRVVITSKGSRQCMACVSERRASVHDSR